MFLLVKRQLFYIGAVTRDSFKESIEEMQSPPQIQAASCLHLPVPYPQAHFRTIDGTPICFLCKRVGHVKKYCRYLKSTFLLQPGLKHEVKGEDHIPPIVSPRSNERISDSVTEPQENICQLLVTLKSLAARVEQATLDAKFNEGNIDEFEESMFQMALLDVTKKIAKVSKAFQRQRENTFIYTRVSRDSVGSHQSPLQPSNVENTVRDKNEVDMDFFLEHVT